jgi:hypothetical protein
VRSHHFPAIRFVTSVVRILLAAHTHTMHLYLGENPRTLYLATSQQDEKLGRPQRVLVFRVSPSNPSQAVVEFLHKDQADLSSAVLITNRAVKGCMGIISVGRGEPVALASDPSSANFTRRTWRDLCRRDHFCYRGRKHSPLGEHPGICRSDS